MAGGECNHSFCEQDNSPTWTQNMVRMGDGWTCTDTDVDWTWYACARGEPLEVINFWCWSTDGCGYGISFSLPPGISPCAMTSVLGLQHEAQKRTPANCTNTLGEGHSLQRYQLCRSGFLCCILPLPWVAWPRFSPTMLWRPLTRCRSLGRVELSDFLVVSVRARYNRWKCKFPTAAKCHTNSTDDSVLKLLLDGHGISHVQVWICVAIFTNTKLDDRVTCYRLTVDWSTQMS